MRSNYLVMITYHERNTFVTNTEVYFDRDLDYILEDLDIDFADCVVNTNGVVQYDGTSRTELSKVEEDTYKVSGVVRVFPYNVIIMDLCNIDKERTMNDFYWGDTNNKYGLFDMKGVD